MKKNWGILLLAAALAAGLFFTAGRQKTEDAVPPMVMVNDELYQLYDFQKEPPSGFPKGEIREVVGNRIPVENGQANFGEAGMPYWETQEGICVFVNVNYLLFKVQE